MAHERPTLPPGTSRQSFGILPVNEEELVRASKLCNTCRPIFDISLPRNRIGGSTFKHHESCDALCQSAAAGCRLCIIVHIRWRHLVTSEHKAPENVSFNFVDALEGTTATRVVIQAEYGNKPSIDVLRSHVVNCKTNTPSAFWPHGILIGKL